MGVGTFLHGGIVAIRGMARDRPIKEYNVHLFADQRETIDVALARMDDEANRSMVIRAAIDEFIARGGLERRPWEAYSDAGSRLLEPEPWDDPGAIQGLDLATEDGAVDGAGQDGSASDDDVVEINAEALAKDLQRQVDVGPLTAKNLVKAGYRSLGDIAEASHEELVGVDNVGERRAEQLKEAADDGADEIEAE